MKTLMLVSALGISLVLPGASIAQNDTAPEPGPEMQAPAKRVIKPQVGVSVAPEVSNAYVIGCYTCGGYYPYRVAAPYLGGYNNRVWEFGARCSGGQLWRLDSRPYLCSNRPF